MATPLLLRQGLLHRLRFTVAAPHRLWCNAATPTTNSSSFSSSEHANEKPSSGVTTNNTSNFLLKPNDPDYCKWKVEEDGILRDDEPILVIKLSFDSCYATLDLVMLVNWYMDGEHLSVEDEKAVVKNLLPYHPHSEDKIGCGIYSIMVSAGF
ncbi:hypothetical protein TanjilG_08214 [Lupinus angustifolius]|uniref:Uncharacterized protein n=1 Tax=Lupinus angustifolius TaxID=3871 RepID=A0A1J7HS76_LUPAN|nr:hypothetical protein TanjilG_08214 [Lupinus angustifolius]